MDPLNLIQDDDIQKAFNTEVIRGDNRHTGRLWRDPQFTMTEGVKYVVANFTNSFLFYFLLSNALIRFWTPYLSQQLIVHVIFVFFIYSGLRFLFFNSTGHHPSVLLSLIGALTVTLGVRSENPNDDTQRLGNVAGEWIKLLLSWIGIIPGAFAGIYATAVFCTAAYLPTFSYGAPMIGQLTYLDPSDPFSTPLANESAAGFMLEMVSSLILFFGYYWANGHKSIARNRFVSSVTIGAAAAFGTAIAAPFTGAPMNILIWMVHAIRTWSTFDFVIYTLAPLSAFAIPTLVVALMFLVNKLTPGDSDSSGVSAAYNQPLSGGFKGSKRV